MKESARKYYESLTPEEREDYSRAMLTSPDATEPSVCRPVPAPVLWVGRVGSLGLVCWIWVRYGTRSGAEDAGVLMTLSRSIPGLACVWFPNQLSDWRWWWFHTHRKRVYLTPRVFLVVGWLGLLFTVFRIVVFR